eukprot:GHVU01003541.1.p1 GENE.GHVU01003541.1~~GHVU01003541.1.p1  ORF type:complete len:329 (-),score=25.48 GHVU01003541.1:95-946(-)
MPITKWELRLTRPGHRPLQPELTAFPLQTQTPDENPPSSSSHQAPIVAATQPQQWQHAPPPLLQYPQRIPQEAPAHQNPRYAATPTYGQNPRNHRPPNYIQSPRYAATPAQPTFTTGLGETYNSCRRCQKNHIGSCWRCATHLIVNCPCPLPPNLLCSNCGRVGHAPDSCLNTTHVLPTQIGQVSVVVFTTPRTKHAVVRTHQRSTNQPVDCMQFIDQAVAIRMHEAELATRTRLPQFGPQSFSPLTPPNTYPTRSPHRQPIMAVATQPNPTPLLQAPPANPQ